MRQAIPAPNSDSSRPAAAPRQAAGVSRRAVVGAAWSAPVILAVAASPLAAASDGGPDALLAWLDTPGVIGDSSVLVLTIPAGSPAVGSTGTLTFSVDGYGNIPGDVQGPTGWTYLADYGQNIGTLTSPPGGVTAGNKGVTVTWPELSSSYTIVTSWSDDRESGSLSTSIEVGLRKIPTLAWTTNPATFGGTTTLRLTVLTDSYAIGAGAAIYFYQSSLPAGTTVVLPTGWATRTDPRSGLTGVATDSLTAGIFDFVYTLGPGTTSTSALALFISNNGGVPLQAPITVD